MVIASHSGRQLAAYAFGASKVIWVVGAQKIVTDLDQAFVRIEQHYLPLESQRLQEVYGQPSSIGKELVIHGEQPGSPCSSSRTRSALNRDRLTFVDKRPEALR